MALVDVRAHDRCTAIYPDQFPAVVRVRTTSGDELVEEVLTNRGGPQRPLSDDELATKFRDNAARVLSVERADAVSAAVAALDTAPGVDEILSVLS